MDLHPHFLHHSSRYDPVPHPHPPLPPPPPASASTPHPQFRETSNFHPHHHNRYLSQPQPQPLPQLPPPLPHISTLPRSYQQSLPPPPPPPPPPSQHHHPHHHKQYNPNQPQFAFSSPTYAHPVQDFTQIRRIDDRPRHRLPDIDHTRPDFSDPSGVLPDIHHRSTEKPYLPPLRLFDQFRHDSEGSSRFRVEYDDGFDPNHRNENLVWGRGDNNYHRRGHILSNSDTSSRDFGFVSNSRDIEPNSGVYDYRFGSVHDNEAYRSGRSDGGHDRQAARDVSDFLYEMGSNEISDGEGVQIGSTKHEYFGLDVARYNHNRGSREGSHEYNHNHTPRKQIQKKSAFLRIQMAKPNHRSRESERSHYSGYFEKTNSGSFRGRDQYMNSGYGMEEEEEQERQGSPVELDVSFKSNSLVAKAIVAPSSSAVVSDADLTPRNEKTRKVSDGDHSNSRLSKLNVGAVNMDSSTGIPNKASTSRKDSKQFEKRVLTSVVGSVHDGNSQPCSSGASASLGKSAVDRSPKGLLLHKNGTVAGCGKTTAPKVIKKKKVVKKVVKKVINHQSRISSSQQTKKFDEPVKADDSTHSPAAASGFDKNATPSEQIRTSDGMTSRSNVFLQPCTDKVNILPENDVADISSLPTVSYDCRINIDSSRTCAPSIKKNLNNSTSPLVSSSREENKIDKSPVNADNTIQSSQSISNSDNDLCKPSNEIHFSGVGSVENVSKQFCHGGLPLLLEKGREKEFTDENVNSAFLSSEEIKIHEDITNSFSSPHGTDSKLGFENDMVKSQENSTVCDIGIKGAIKKEPSTNQFTTSFVNGIVEEIHEGLVGSSAILGLSSSEEIDICQGLVYAECSNHGRDATRNSDNGHGSLEEKKNNVFNRGTINDAGKHPSPGGATVSQENFRVEESLNGMVLVRACEDNTLKIKKRRNTRTQLNFSNSTDICVEPVNDAVGPETPANTTLNLSVKGSCPVEVAVSDVGSLDGILPGADGISVLHAKSSVPGLSEEFTVKNDVHGYLNETSPRYKKKRGVSVSDSALSRPTVSETNEGPTGTSTCCAEVSLTSNDDLTQKEGEVAVSSINYMCSTGFTVLIENTSEVRFAEAVGATRDVLSDDYLKLFDVGVESCSHAGDPNAQSPCPSGFGSEQKENSAVFIADNINQNDVMDIDTSGGEKMEANDAKNKVLIHGETPRCKVTSEPQSPDLYQRLSNSDMESDYLLVKDNLPLGSNYLSLSDDGAGVSSSNTNDEVMDAVSGTLPDIGFPEISAEVLSIRMLNCKQPPGQLSNEKVCGDDQKFNQKTVVGVSSNAPAHTSFPQSTKLNLATGIDHPIVGKTVPLPSQDSKLTSHSLNLTSAELMGSKTQLIHSLPKTFPGRSSFFSNNSKKTASSTHIVKPRTWHRTGNPSVPPLSGNKPFSNTFPPRRKLVENNGKTLSTSYIRKGNSLVRKPALVAARHQGSHGLSSSVYRANSSVAGESRKSTGSDGRFDDTDPQNLLRTGIHTPIERPGTPPLPNGTKLPTQNAGSSGDKSSSSQVEHPNRVCCETTSAPMKLTEANNLTNTAEDSLKISEISENLTGTSNNLESQTELSDGNVSSFNTRKIVYVKRKSNQLVATSSPCDLSVQNGSKVQAGSEGYYKRSKNQLIRASLENQIKQSVAVCDDLLNSERQQAPKVVSSRKFTKRRQHKVVAKTCKPIKSSLVWTLRGMQSSKDERDSLHHQKVLPHLFPWKRGTYWRNFMHNQIPISNNSSLSMISRKLLLLRKRDTVYTRSINGFSLRKFKVLSVGGSSLKWSKSIEKNSKKANEEATLAVAAVERKKREQIGSARSCSRTKNRNHSSRESFRERIFRIGSFRYKMDSTKQTLQRISGDECPGSTAAPSEKDTKKSYIPRRLVIGNDEYVRIGNGNQLIRDPKKRTRKLASEKVRWSLHTARLRLARKRKYCQFFTRFGKCNKDDGKCPYIHDSSKIAVCTKFLNGLCSNPNCKLTHKVIPERMPDCSFFLQGLCNNRSCPYRHVNVNPKASTCEGFLKGYCADGNECRKKHSYVCPVFEATGTCPEGSKCKLHHPKNRSKGKKRKRVGAQKNARGRYFGSMHINVSEPGTTVFEKHPSHNNDDLLLEGKFADYIGLDVSDEEVGESNDPGSEQTFCDSDLSDVQFDDLDQLIKPVRIMN
ncbi:hypothetical protein CIPAW_15G030900 [Carya illinoinensis]|uniref:C3H1-type domain-containing protein n=1 Tax=Carya illinoinensis TaxID=32201 RepID=A0A8T1N7E2_CARIL|nr:hypothetical protein CIPAW_15G030900 [Carya illinoinensis]